MLNTFTTLAHVKWFTTNNSHEIEPIFHFDLQQTPILIAVISVVAAMVIAYIMDKKIKEPSTKFLKHAEKIKPEIIRIFQILVGISIIFASYRGAVLQPHYTGAAGQTLISIIEIITGLLLILNRGTCLASIMLLITYISTFVMFGAFEAIDYINLVGIAAFLFLEKPKKEKAKKHSHLGLPLLRVFTGFALLILAFSEKLLFPYKAAELVEKYHLNFMSALGIHSFNNEVFILAAGVVEMIFALILIFGWIPRINILALSGFFVASNLFFLLKGYPSEALTELMGHLPVIATAMVIAIYGSGSFKKTNE